MNITSDISEFSTAGYWSPIGIILCHWNPDDLRGYHFKKGRKNLRFIGHTWIQKRARVAENKTDSERRGLKWKEKLWFVCIHACLFVILLTRDQKKDLSDIWLYDTCECVCVCMRDNRKWCSLAACSFLKWMSFIYCCQLFCNHFKTDAHDYDLFMRFFSESLRVEVNPDNNNNKISARKEHWGWEDTSIGSLVSVGSNRDCACHDPVGNQ